MPRLPFVFTLLSSALLLAACKNDPTEPSARAVNVKATISQDTIADGDTATLTLLVENTTGNTVQLGFRTGCQLEPLVKASNNEIAYPPGGGYMCTMSLTSMTLDPYGMRSGTVDIHGTSSGAMFAGVLLKPGTYKAYAVLQSNGVTGEMRSAPVTFTVR